MGYRLIPRVALDICLFPHPSSWVTSFASNYPLADFYCFRESSQDLIRSCLPLILRLESTYSAWILVGVKSRTYRRSLPFSCAYFAPCVKALFRKLNFTTVLTVVHFRYSYSNAPTCTSLGYQFGWFYWGFDSGVSYTLHIRPIRCHLDTARDGLSPSRIDKLSRFQLMLSLLTINIIV